MCGRAPIVADLIRNDLVSVERRKEFCLADNGRQIWYQRWNALETSLGRRVARNICGYDENLEKNISEKDLPLSSNFSSWRNDSFRGAI